MCFFTFDFIKPFESLHDKSHKEYSSCTEHRNICGKYLELYRLYQCYSNAYLSKHVFLGNNENNLTSCNIKHRRQRLKKLGLKLNSIKKELSEIESKVKKIREQLDYFITNDIYNEENMDYEEDYDEYIDLFPEDKLKFLKQRWAYSVRKLLNNDTTEILSYPVLERKYSVYIYEFDFFDDSDLYEHLDDDDWTDHFRLKFEKHMNWK